jgi:SAM-dependent methyltransferase
MNRALRAVTARYGDTSRAYRRFWAPALAALSRPLITALPLEAGDVVVDLGCGVGTIGARLARRARIVIGLDATEQMLSRVRGRVLPAAADIRRMPVADGTLDGAISTFVLQHVRETRTVFEEIARTLRPGGFVATATWGTDHAEAGGAYAVLDEVFARHRIPGETPGLKTWHENVDEPVKIERHARAAGLTVERAWAARSTYRWPVANFIGWATEMGPYGRRLAASPDVVRARIAHDLRNDIAALPEDAFRWTPECVYAIAIKP